MSIVAECPHCETRFNLQPDMAGKSMRCPNPDCREVFVVRGAEPLTARPSGGKPPKPPKPQNQTSGAVGDFVPVVDAEMAPLPPDPSGRPDPLGSPGKKRKPAAPPEPQVVEATVVAPPPAREVVWSADTDLPPPGGGNGKDTGDGGKGKKRSPVRAAAVEDDPEDDEPIFVPRRKKKKNNRAVVFIFVGVALIVGLIGLGAFKVWSGMKKNEEQDAKIAMEQFKKGEYAPAGKSFDKLVAEYPGSNDKDKYKFLSDLCGVRVAANVVTNKENPTPALEKLKAFIQANKDSPLARPTENGFGGHIFDAGRKIGDDMADFINDRIAAFRKDRTKTGELTRAEEMIASAKELIPLVTPFREKDSPGLDKLTDSLTRSQGELDRERSWIATIGRLRVHAANPTDENIEEMQRDLAASGFSGDEQGEGLIREAKSQFYQRVKFEPDPLDPVDRPGPATPSVLIVAPVGPTKPPVRDDLVAPAAPAVFLAVARGVLYAIDEDGGNLLWAVRVGSDVYDPPAVARVALAEGPTDLVLVTSSVAGLHTLTAVNLRSGVPRWHQPLLAPAAGPAVVVGTRAYVPMRDPLGTIYEYDLTNGNGTRISHVRLGQPVALAPAVLRPGTGQLFVAADARRVFVFDVDARDDDGNRLQPRCVRVIPTGHLPGALYRTPPVILGTTGNGPGNRWLILSQVDGSRTMKLRAFPVPDQQPLPPDAPPAMDMIATEAELALPGFAWFPPVFDGERLATVTDLGQFRLFGVNQPGNADAAVYELPSPPLPTPAGDETIPGLVIPAEEGGFWVLAGGNFQRFRLSLLPDKGLSMVGVGSPVPLGAATQAAQWNAHRDTVCFVVRSVNSSGYRAVAIRVRDGEVRWQRQLGAVAAAAPVPGGGGGAVLAEEDGGAVVIPATGVELPPGGTKAAPAEWIVVTPPDGVAGPTTVVTSPDGKIVFTVTPVGPADARKLVIRRLVDGKLDHTGTVTPLAPPARDSRPAVMAGTLLLPLADGIVYRLVLGDGKLKADGLAPGPKWWTDRRQQNPEAFIVAISDDTFLVSDGGKGLAQWKWPAGGNASDGQARWEVRERIVTPPLLLPTAGGKPARMLVADAAGGVWLYALDRPGPPLRSWRPGKTAAIPAGVPSSAFTLQTDPNGRQVVAFVVDRKRVVVIDADQDLPLWVTPTADEPGGVGVLVGTPQPAGEGRWLLTELSGRVSVHDGPTGKQLAVQEIGLPGAVPAAAGTLIGSRRVLVPLSDGTVAVVQFPEEAPPPKGKE